MLAILMEFWCKIVVVLINIYTKYIVNITVLRDNVKNDMISKSWQMFLQLLIKISSTFHKLCKIQLRQFNVI